MDVLNFFSSNVSKIIYNSKNEFLYSWYRKSKKENIKWKKLNFLI